MPGKRDPDWGTHQTSFVTCAQEGCENKHPNHYWGNVKAHDEGWFASRQEHKSWCPEHVPEWVPEWRARQQAKKDKAGAYALLEETFALPKGAIQKARFMPDGDLELYLKSEYIDRNVAVEAQCRLDGTWVEPGT